MSTFGMDEWLNAGRTLLDAPIPAEQYMNLILDPGAADAPMGGYPTREAAQKAADAHDWFTDEGGEVHFCKPCTDESDALINEMVAYVRRAS